MNALEVRALFFNRKLKIVDLAVELPELSELNGLLAIRELTAKDAVQAEALSKDSTGETDQAETLAATVIRSLILRETKEAIFSDTDIEIVAGFGLSVLSPLGTQIKNLSGLDQTTLDATKKNLTPTASSASATSSPGN